MQQAHCTQGNQVVAWTIEWSLVCSHTLIAPLLSHLETGTSMAYFRRRLSPIKPGDPIDYKDVDLLRKFITERGKILPRRISGLTARQQRDLTVAIKRARMIALLPYVNREG